MNCLFIKPYHIQRLKGITSSQASKVYTSIKDALAKEKYQEVTINEYANYIGVAVEEIEDYLNKR